MIKHPQLQAVSSGHASFQEAAVIFEAMMADRDPAKDRAFYEALRDWTWKALHARRLDAELGQWRDLIEGVRARLPDDGTAVRASLRVLSELVSISMSFAAKVTDDAVANYAHVPEILAAVVCNAGAIGRQELKAQFQLSDSRLSQLLTVLVHSGHLDREPRGRNAAFVITDRGRKLLTARQSSDASVERVASTKPNAPIKSDASIKSAARPREAAQAPVTAQVETKLKPVQKIEFKPDPHGFRFATWLYAIEKNPTTKTVKIMEHPFLERGSRSTKKAGPDRAKPGFIVSDEPFRMEKIIVSV